MTLYFGCCTWTLSFELLALNSVTQCPLSSAKLPAGSSLFPAKPLNCLFESVEELLICTTNHSPTSHLLEPCWAVQGCSWPWQMLPVLSMWPRSPSTNTILTSGLAFSPAQHWLYQTLAAGDAGSAKGSRDILKKPVPLNLLPKTPWRGSLTVCHKQPASCSENKKHRHSLN